MRRASGSARALACRIPRPRGMYWATLCAQIRTGVFRCRMPVLVGNCHRRPMCRARAHSTAREARALPPAVFRVSRNTRRTSWCAATSRDVRRVPRETRGTAGGTPTIPDMPPNPSSPPTPPGPPRRSARARFRRSPSSSRGGWPRSRGNPPEHTSATPSVSN